MTEHTNRETMTVRKSTLKWLVVVVIALVAGFFIGSFTSTGQAAPRSTTQIQAPAPSPGPSPNQGALRLAVSVDDDPALGDPNAPVTMIEFSDFECPFCGRFYQQTLSQLENDYINTGKVRFVYRDFPLTSIHPAAQKAAEAAECAEEQGKWREMHNWIFENQRLWAGSEAAAVPQFKQAAGTLGLGQAQFDSCLDSGKYESEVLSDFTDGTNAGVSGTPTFFINGQQVVGAQPYSVFKQIIDQELAA